MIFYDKPLLLQIKISLRYSFSTEIFMFFVRGNVSVCWVFLFYYVRCTWKGYYMYMFCNSWKHYIIIIIYFIPCISMVIHLMWPSLCIYIIYFSREVGFIWVFCCSFIFLCDYILFSMCPSFNILCLFRTMHNFYWYIISLL